MLSYIYGLADPRSLCIRYVGWTIDTKVRYSNHLRQAKRENNYKANWIKQLLSVNLLPIIIILEEVPLDDWQWYEKWWIAYGKTQHWPLANATLGGEGTLGWKPSEDWIKRNKNRPISQQTLKKMSDSHKGLTPSDEARHNMSMSHIGRKHTKQTIETISSKLKGENNPNWGKSLSQDHKDKISESKRGEKNPSSHYTESQVFEMRNLYDNGMSVRDLMYKYKGSRSTIGKIVYRYTWKHLS